jgi:hypothetical protein
MTRTSQNPKRTKISVYKPKGKKQKYGSGSMVILTPIKTRRGKTIYTEVDASSYYKSSDEEGEPPKRKPSKTPSGPSSSRATIPALLENTLQWEASCLDGQEPCVSRITKVRL